MLQYGKREKGDQSMSKLPEETIVQAFHLMWDA